MEVVAYGDLAAKGVAAAGDVHAFKLIRIRLD
jgi:hypothetical protein